MITIMGSLIHEIKLISDDNMLQTLIFIILTTYLLLEKTILLN